MPQISDDTHLVKWDFIDINAYYASVEQEINPQFCGQPVAVVPTLVKTSCCIAASYEAKAFGIKTGTLVSEAQAKCPDIILVEARPLLYVEFHHKIVKAIDSILPVTAVMSVDEMACKLIDRERELKNAFYHRPEHKDGDPQPGRQNPEMLCRHGAKSIAGQNSR